jgi:hypothetical protein
MKAMCKKLFTFFLTGVIFISSTGFGLIEHTCLVTRTKSASVLNKHSCCPKNNTSDSHNNLVLKSDACCEVEAHIADIDLAPVVEKVAGFFSHVFYYVLDTFLNFFQALLLASEPVFNSSDSSPPLAGRELLIRHQTFLI